MGSPDPLITFRRVPPRAGFQRGELETFALLLRTRILGGRDFHCLITGDAELRRLNRTYLGRDYPADVLSFPSANDLSANDLSANGDFVGDLAISRQRAACQALQFGHSLMEELQLLLLHGVLHLTGMDHEQDHGEMARAERRWQIELDLPTPLIRRTVRRALRRTLQPESVGV